jgi:hypothetical protein
MQKHVPGTGAIFGSQPCEPGLQDPSGSTSPTCMEQSNRSRLRVDHEDGDTVGHGNSQKQVGLVGEVTVCVGGNGETTPWLPMTNNLIAVYLVTQDMSAEPNCFRQVCHAPLSIPLPIPTEKPQVEIGVAPVRCRLHEPRKPGAPTRVNPAGGTVVGGDLGDAFKKFI